MTRQLLAAPSAQPVREVMFDLSQGLPLRLQQPKVEEQEPDATCHAVEPESAVKEETALDVQIRFGGEEQEHVATGSCYSAGEAASPVGKYLAE